MKLENVRELGPKELENNWVKAYAEKLGKREWVTDQAFQELRHRVEQDVTEANDRLQPLFPHVQFQFVPGSPDLDKSFAVRRIRNGNLQEKQMWIVRFWKEPNLLRIAFEHHQVNGRSTVEVDLEWDPDSQEPTFSYDNHTPCELWEISEFSLKELFSLSSPS